ncbi:HEAT repeat domain-containing protein [Planktothrix sp. FACHB-1355]|uniref:HEAT repeat domain-containing protein n=1 Tax=Aerosakkonema funiforme FACHB-1375 TaxID=2949571 RepID=A0A926VFF5_9CYAN|nr:MULTISPECIES: HEAT repeat domain-containing protein [Oscillatoriales]MBD2182761.1 HEAT repeat domain-containing protein [Aerosakkonema funiforme FACHB-1375]MBD3563367.1 HEAT repeat domain-containing protein [Planktothrix sp. FACHB-1355]
MLENLETIDWHQLTHAYGPADDIPVLIRYLTSENTELREAAIYELYGNIWHQGSVYEASAFAIPFLIELLQNEHVQKKEQILILLAYLARGNSWHKKHQNSIFLIDDRDTPEFQEKVKIEQTWVVNARNRVYEGLRLYLNLLADADPKIRIASAYTLACLPDRAPEIIPEMLKCLHREADRQAKASMVLSLGTLVEPESKYLALFTEILHSKTSDLVKLVAAMMLTQLARNKTPQEAIAFLVNTISDSKSVAELYSQLPWADGDVVADVSRYFCYLEAESNQFPLTDLIEALSTVDAYSALTVAETLLYVTFNGKTILADEKMSELTKTQRIVLSAIAQSENTWKYDANMSQILKSFALPMWREKLLALVGGELA